MPVHGRYPLLVFLEPSVWVERVCIVAKDGLVTVFDPAVDPYDDLILCKPELSWEAKELTPSGKKTPLMVTPPSGTTLSSGRPVAGCIRKASLMTAWRYDISWL